MLRSIVSALIGYLVVNGVVASAQQFPRLPPPKVAVARIADDQTLQLVLQVSETVREERTKSVTETVIVDGKPEKKDRTVTYIVNTIVFKQVAMSVKKDDFRVGVTGNPPTV